MTKKKPPEEFRATVRMPAELWKRIRIRAIETGTTAEALVIAALEAYLKGAK